MIVRPSTVSVVHRRGAMGGGTGRGSYAKVLCVDLVGVTGHVVEGGGRPRTRVAGIVISGLPDTALHEARDRVHTPIVNSGQKWPNRRITLNLLPATLRRYGSAFD